MPVYPPKPQPGDQVAVLSPGAALPEVFPAPYELGLRRLQRDFGLRPVEYPTTRRWSSPRARADDVMAAFADPEIKAIVTSIGGSDQLKVLRYLDPDVIRDNPKPFFGISDNTNLHHYLFNLGLVSYYGGTVMTMLGRPATLNDHSAFAFTMAMFTSQWYDLRPADSYTDMERDWSDPSWADAPPEMLPGTGWVWHGPRDEVVEGRLWGGSLEIVDFQLRAGRYLLPEEEYDGAVLFLETSEELPSSEYVWRLLMCMAERGLLQRFSAVLMGRPKGWSLERQHSPLKRRAYVETQREAVLEVFAEYRIDIPIVFDVDFGHTDPQLVVPHGGDVRIDPVERQISVHY
jgi:muramoyltetrapeptide carboxypeptidase LdcA involved in peptidoglycan recycling